jgi:hypothetical protein
MPQASPTAEAPEAQAVEEAPTPKRGPARKITPVSKKKKTASKRPAKKKGVAS